MTGKLFYFDGTEVLNLNHVVFVSRMVQHDNRDMFNIILSNGEHLPVYDPTNCDYVDTSALVAKRTHLIEALKNVTGEIG